jgi:hypothetical protein
MQLLSEHVPQDAHNSGEKIHLFEQLVRHLAAVTGSELRIYGSHKRIYRARFIVAQSCCADLSKVNFRVGTNTVSRAIWATKNLTFSKVYFPGK